MARRDIHVVPAPSGGWSVMKTGAERASKNFDQKTAAVDYGRWVSRAERSELVIHKKDGTIQQKDSYGGDPLPPKDKR